MKSLRQVLVRAFATLFMWLAGSALVQASALAPRVDGFDIEQVPQLSAGTALHFSLYGSPGASATVRIDGVPRALPLQEVQGGMYEGTHVIDRDDRITAHSRVTAQVWLADEVTTAELEEPLLLGAATVRRCDECGVVEAIRTVEGRDRPGYAGAIAGGVIGAILGSQFGKGDGRTAAGILGAVGGAYAGREIERHGSTRTRYDVVVRLQDGSARVKRYDGVPPFRVGERVRMADGALLPDSNAVSVPADSGFIPRRQVNTGRPT
jgi:outer membrane lipoprotein SlyB